MKPAIESSIATHDIFQSLADGFVDDEMTISGSTIPIKRGKMPHSILNFFPENPRVYSVLRVDGKEPSQEDIERHLITMEHVKKLIQDINSNGGLIDPIIVKDGSLEVLEGNSRLAAYRALATDYDPIKWALIDVVVLPNTITTSMIYALLAQYHIKGKQEWTPYEQAGFLFRRYIRDKIDIEDLAMEISDDLSEVKNKINTYKFMSENGETEQSRWSYYYEYIKSRKIKSIRNTHPNFDNLIIEKVRSGEIKKATDIRDKLKVICQGGKKTLERFTSRQIDLDTAFDIVEESGSVDQIYKRLNSIRQWLVRRETTAHIKKLEGEAKNKVLYEIRQLDRKIANLKKQLEK